MLSFKKTADKTVHTKYYLSTVEIKHYNVMINQRSIQELNFTGNLALKGNVNTTMFFIIEEVKETNLDFPQRNVRIL